MNRREKQRSSAAGAVAAMTVGAFCAACGQTTPAVAPGGTSSTAPIATSAAMAATAPMATSPTPQRSLLALSKAAHTLSIVSPATLQVVARAPVGPDPHEVIASSDGKTAYVSNTGGGGFHRLDVIDLVAQKALPDIDTGALLGPHGLAFVGNELWFTAEGAKAVARYDPATTKFDWIVGTGQNRTHMVYVTPEEKRIYTTNVASGTASVLENVLRPPPGPPPGAAPAPGPSPGGPPPGAQPRMDWDQTVIPMAPGVEGFDVSPDGRSLWAASAQDGTIFIVDLAEKKVTSTIDAKVFGANRLKFTPDGKLVVVSSLRSGDLAVFDVTSRKEYRRVPIGHGAAGILMDPDGSRVFVACTPDDYVAVVDLRTFAVTGRIDVGGKPDGLAWAVRP
jgi:YVTN family beta-propeller protein